ITNGEHAVMMTDIIGLDHFHIGKASNEMTAKMLGIPLESGYIQFVPAGVRTTLAYTTPIQTSKDFDNAIKSAQFRRLEKKIGEKELFALMGKDAEENGTPIVPFLDQLEAKLNGKQTSSNVKASFVGGVYEDGLPWSGVMAEVDTKKQKWNFAAHTANKEPKNVPGLVKEYIAKSGNKNKIELAWNGGYILNPELVGKLGLPETYIGSPLGLLIMNEEVECPPLFNKPAIIIYKDGRIDIRKVNCRAGLAVRAGGKTVQFAEDQYNRHSNTQACYYDLIYEEEHIRGDGNVIIRLAGNTVKQIIHTNKGEEVKCIPVGLTLSIPADQLPKGIFKEGKKVDIELFEPTKNKFRWSEISYAVEAGPMLIDKAKKAVDLVSEGWKTSNSIRTQAARLDFTDMRGPKIALGVTNAGKLMVLMVNGRIRESVGATHFDMADILKRFGMDKAMGFDPGGSSTLVVDGKVMNISPYNKKYEADIYSLPPEPRFVANAVVGWIEN
ncbi:MAG TPA: phosphodiester glycosidase family protein, partial [Bacteroidetes bacterium]|nr:phosphodiester glycosidase family protein [Bacteroidota bacterium]